MEPSFYTNHVDIGSAVVQWLKLQILGYENPDSNHVLPCQVLGKFFHQTLLQFTQLYGEYLAIDSDAYLCNKSAHGWMLHRKAGTVFNSSLLLPFSEYARHDGVRLSEN